MAIRDAPLKRGVNAGVKYGLHFAGIDACVAAGLDVWTWENGGYPTKFMERMMAWHRLKGLISVHIEDARQAAAEKAAKKK